MTKTNHKNRNKVFTALLLDSLDSRAIVWLLSSSVNSIFCWDTLNSYSVTFFPFRTSITSAFTAYKKTHISHLRLEEAKVISGWGRYLKKKNLHENWLKEWKREAEFLIMCCRFLYPSVKYSLFCLKSLPYNLHYILLV